MTGFAVTGGIDPRVDGFDFADGSVLNEFDAGAVVFVRVNLVAHPCDDFGLGGQEFHLAGFPYVVSERFLTVYVYASAHGVHGDNGVHVVWCGDGNGINFAFHFAEHVPVILKDGGFGLEVFGFVRAGEVNVAEGYVFGFGMG